MNEDTILKTIGIIGTAGLVGMFAAGVWRTFKEAGKEETAWVPPPSGTTYR